MFENEFIDASVGDCAVVFNEAAEYALRQAMPLLNQYDNDGTISKNIMRDIHGFFNNTLKIKNPSFHGGVPLTSFGFTLGITDGYNFLLSELVKNNKKYNELREKEVKPVIIMPIPTYGLFLEHPKKYGIEIVEIKRENDGSVCPQKLDSLIYDIHKDGNKRVISYYDSNPNNPTGYIRNREATENLAEIFKKHKKIAKELYEIDRMAMMHNNPNYHIDEFNNNIKIIDDMAYLGTEHTEELATPFMAIDNMYDQSFILAGTSKIGLAGMRSGILIGDENYIIKLKRKTKLNNYFLPYTGMFSLVAAFPTDENLIKSRQEHLDRMNKKHAFSGKFMKALINGIDDVSVSNDEYYEMIKLVKNKEIIGTKDAISMLKNGVDGVTTTTSADAGFFHLLDYSELKGRTYTPYNANNFSVPNKIAKDEIDIADINKSANIKFCSGNHSGLAIEDMVVRCSFAVSPERVIDIVNKIKLSKTRFIDIEETNDEDLSQKTISETSKLSIAIQP